MEDALSIIHSFMLVCQLETLILKTTLIIPIIKVPTLLILQSIKTKINLELIYLIPFMMLQIKECI